MKLLRTPLAGALLGLVALAPSLAAFAAEVKPVAVVSVASVEEILGDIGYVTKLAGMEDMGRTARLLGSALTSGMDKKRPAGMYVVPEAGDFHGIAFIPVSNLKQLLEIHEQYIGVPSDEGDGVLKIEAEGRTAFIKEQNGWAFIAETKEHLTNLPQDPSTLLGDLPKKYNIAAKVLIQNIPQELRQMAIDEIKFGLNRGLDSPALDRPNLDKEAVEQAARGSLDSVQRYLDEAEELSIGWAVDAAAKKTYIDMSIVAREGSALAKQLALQAEAKTSFAGLKLPGASVCFNICSKMTEQEIGRLSGTAKSIRKLIQDQIDDDPNLEADKRDKAKATLGKLFDHIDKTVAAGKIDGGAALVLAPEAINLVAAAHVSDGAGIEQSLKEIAELAKNDPEFPQIKFNIASHAGVQFHKLTTPIPPHEVEARQFLGETLEVVIGTGPSSVFLVAGKNCDGLLKTVIDRSSAEDGKTVVPFQVDVAALPILKFFSAVDDRPIVPALVAALEQSGNDHILITSQPTARGGSLRIEVQEGLLKLIGEAVKQFGADFGDVL